MKPFISAPLKLPELVLIHGMFSQPWVWDNYREQYEKAGYTVHTPALRHHESNAELNALSTTSIADYMADLEAFIATLDCAPVLIGHSLGGILSQMLAAKLNADGKRGILAIALVTPGAPAPLFPVRLVSLPAVMRNFLRWGFWRKPFSLSKWGGRYLVFNNMPEPKRSELAEKLIAESGRVATQLTFAPITRRKSPAFVAADSLNCPALALAGQKDRTVPIGVSRRIARYYGRNIEYRELSQHGHWPLGEEGWEYVANEIQCWIREQIKPTTKASS